MSLLILQEKNRGMRRKCTFEFDAGDNGGKYSLLVIAV
jgi:hypothetical protein